MRSKILAAVAVVTLMMTAGCSTFQRVIYRPDINQGNYLAPGDAAKIQKGMSRQQVVYTLGTPIMQDPFGSNVWYYVFRQQLGHKSVTQQTLTLTFDSAGILVGIENKPALNNKTK